MIDESLYSRQLYVVGQDAMEKMMKSTILVVGLNALGQEVAKNLCLTGVSRVVLYDPELVIEKDFQSGFLISKMDIGSRRDEAVLYKMKKLNEYVKVEVAQSIESFKEYNLVISCNKHMYDQIKLNRQARRDGCKFIGGQARGLFSQFFCDFGTDFICVDTNGEPSVTGMINNINTDGILTVVNEQRHNLEDGDIIKIHNKEYYEGVLFRVECLNMSSVKLVKIDGASIIECTDIPFKFVETYGGDFEQVKRPKIVNFQSMEDTIDNPKILSYHFDSDNQNMTAHKAFKCLSEYMEKHKEHPKEEAFVSYFIKTYNDLYGMEKFLWNFSRHSDTLFVPMCSVIGGFMAQEALKALSYKFMPLVQYLYYDAYDLVPEIEMDKETTNCGRYASIVKIFGIENAKKIFSTNLFLVGAGAIGCEHLKNLVMSGVATDGELMVTDNDSIEQSNLSRQFLFRKEDVGKMKAEVAIQSSCVLNEDYENGSLLQEKSKTNLKFYNLKVGKETEEVFSDERLENIHVVANALDNVEARMYMDSRCVLLKKPLVDAGTLGTKGNVQVVVPNFSESYGSSRDPPEKSIPQCTIRNFPHAIEHTIEWAMSEFKLLFCDQIVKLMEYLQNKNTEDDDQCDECIQELVVEAPVTIKDAIKLGLKLFGKYFHTSIQKLLQTFPPDCLTKEGQPFWMPPKRAPEPINFDLQNDLHLTFVRSVANIYMCVFSVNALVDNEYVKKHIQDELHSLDEACDQYSEEETPKEEIKIENLVPTEFEKDCDVNNHVDFVFACANLRAANYKIKQETRLFVKGIAGRIIPAIATTTSVVSGLACIEIMKLILQLPTSKYKNSFLNLALPFFGLSDLVAAEQREYVVEGEKFKFTMWNRLEYKDTTLKNIIKAFEIQFKVKVSMVTVDSKLVYWDCDKKYLPNLNKKVSDLSEKVNGRRLVVVDILTEDEEYDYPMIAVLV